MIRISPEPVVQIQWITPVLVPAKTRLSASKQLTALQSSGGDLQNTGANTIEGARAMER
jgi:hypothetical protein